MLSISMAYNVISCKKIKRNTQKSKPLNVNLALEHRNDEKLPKNG